MFSNLDIVFSLLHRDFAINEGKNITIPCGDNENPSVWSRDGKTITNDYNVIIVSMANYLHHVFTVRIRYQTTGR